MRVSALKALLLTLGCPVHHNWSTGEAGTYIVWTIHPVESFDADDAVESRIMELQIDLFDTAEYSTLDGKIFKMFGSGDINTSIELVTSDSTYDEKMDEHYTHFVYSVTFCLEGELDG